MPCSFVPLVSVLGLYILYKILDRVVRWPRVGRYSERYILVTGCGRGFGFLSCVQLDRLGCHVIAGCRSEMGEAELRKACSSRLHIVRLDVSNPESVRKAYETVKSILPPGKGNSHLYMSTYVPVCLSACMYVCLYRYACIYDIYVCLYACIGMCIYVCICLCSLVCLYRYAFI